MPNCELNRGVPPQTPADLLSRFPAWLVVRFKNPWIAFLVHSLKLGISDTEVEILVNLVPRTSKRGRG